MIIKVMTLFPEMFVGPLGNSIIQRAKENGIVDIAYINMRDYADNKHKKVDDYPYGGGPGMVMTPQPIFDCYNDIVNTLVTEENQRPRVIYLSPKGKTFDQQMAIELSKEKSIVMICGHYEGIDQRVIDEIVTDEISIGDYVLTGGEIPAMVIIDAIARLVPGVLSQDQSFEEESFYSGLLEYPQYTRPKDFRGLIVPDILTSGDHKKIEEWRRRKSLKLTFERRPDLLKGVELSKKDKVFLESIKEEK
ncbi:tRNA (guanosine(37)-N1)-methyltransferase TrmD [Alkaliphilus sp. MSJ-5]|uniref:tRNA (guanine-N(1)-)-methyltransferase n=1 Tax=Alkaliphilus flagellatus TaxID=2841507 RepID=A0ABS6G4U7_9FIRM|nr:tRNA (guanosine(37)-N1)-methyltransferase TrmD [Alkaliphilus flagellatus]MBU5677399.1 tRNA (guanosine(37)-N1)-methyltransferase TrmD [Alkaliphilus flagellatus]